MTQENGLNKFNARVVKTVKSLGDATWNYGEDFTVGLGRSFNHFFRPTSSIKDTASEWFIAGAKVIGGGLVGTLGGILVGAEVGGVAGVLSLLGTLSQEQAAYFSIYAAGIGAILGEVVGFGLYHASIGRKERRQRVDSQRRLRRFNNS